MASPREFGSIRHLVGRFVGSLLPVGPPRGDELWARKHLLPGERTLWQRMSGADRRHAVAVARRTLTDLDQATGDLPVAREVVAAALLHDVGKIEAALGTWARAGVTVAAMAVGRRIVDLRDQKSQRPIAGVAEDGRQTGPSGASESACISVTTALAPSCSRESVATPSRSRGPASTIGPRSAGAWMLASVRPSRSRTMIDRVLRHRQGVL